MTTFDVQLWDDGSARRVSHEAGRFVRVEPIAARAGLSLLAPGLFDLQVNGALGRGFTNAVLTVEDVATISETMAIHGVTGYLPTVITSSTETILAALTTLHNAVEQDAELRAMIPGFHLEGPFLNPADGPRGAHPRVFIRDAKWDTFRRFQDAAGGHIRLVTLAPEVPGALPLIAKLVEAGIVVSLGHTMATRAELRNAVDVGATMSTHLGNGIAATLPRHDNPIWPQLADDRLTAAVIADGDHLPADVLQCIARIKGPERLVLTSDAAGLAGLPPGRYREWGQELEITDTGRIVLAGTPYLAGSGRFLDDCFQRFRNTTGWNLRQTIIAASITPRRLLRLPLPVLAAGKPTRAWMLVDEDDITLLHKPKA